MHDLIWHPAHLFRVEFVETVEEHKSTHNLPHEHAIRQKNKATHPFAGNGHLAIALRIYSLDLSPTLLCSYSQDC
jgi:hypothetical protein